MKKLISSVLAATMLVTPLVGSACFADEVNKQNVQYVQNKNRSEKFKFKKYEYPKIKKILAGVAAGTIALTGATVAALKKFEDKLPENLKAKLPLLFTKETQGDNESEKALEDFKEGEDVEIFIEGSNIAKDETVEPAGVENGNGFIHDEIIGPLTPNYTKPTIKNITIESIKKGEDVENFIEKSNITKDKTVEPAGVENGNGFIHDEIIRPLTPNNTKPAIVGNVTNNTTDTNSTNWVSGLKNTIANSAKVLAGNTILTISSVFLAIFSQRIKSNFEIEAGTAVGAVGTAIGAVGAVLGLVLGTKVIAEVGTVAGTVAGAAAIAAGEAGAAAVGAATAGEAGATAAVAGAITATAAATAVATVRAAAAEVAKILS
mgnify:CR=1 FL=1